jgi:hypothetical protein
MEGATTGLPPALADKATSSIAAAEAIGQRMGAHGHALITQAQGSFMDGLTTSLIGGALVLAFGAVFVLLRAPGRAESRANAGLAPASPLVAPQRA